MKFTWKRQLDIFEIWDHRTFFVDFYQLIGPIQLSQILNEIGFESTVGDDFTQIWKKKENISCKIVKVPTYKYSRATSKKHCLRCSIVTDFVVKS